MATSTLSPRDRFQTKTEFIREHQKTVGSPAWDAAADAAMLQWVHSTELTGDPALAAALYHRIMGAREFLKVLKTIAEIQVPKPPKSFSENLETNQ